MLRKFVHRKLVLLAVMLAGTVYSFCQNTSNKGRDFWVGYGHHQFMETGANDMNMRLYLSTEDQAAVVTVTIDSSGNPFLPVNTIGGIWKKTYNIPPYTAIQTDIIPKGPVNVAAAPGDLPSDPYWDARLYDLPPASGGTGGSGLFMHKGIHIESSVPITAYAHIYGNLSSGATMLIPTTAWGYEYVSLNSNQSYAANCYNWTYVVAYKDNTVIQITPSVKTRAQNRTGLLPGVTSTVTLMKGQIYQLIGANLASDNDGNGGASNDGYNLSGTRIKSIADASGECYPIAVFAGSSRTSNPASCGSGGGDNDNQQLFPMHSWGKKYLTAPFSPSTNPAGTQNNIIKVAFSEPPPATQLKRNGVVVPVPAGSLFYTYESSTADLIEADKPIMVNQFMNGAASCLNGGVGDPEMVVVAPVEQAIKEVTFYRQSRQGITTNYVTLIVPTQGLASLRIDNSAAFDHTYPHPRNAIIGKDYTVVVKRWNIGAGQGYQCNIRCDSAFNAITYGLGSVESYAYSAGAYINNLNALTGIHNQPDITNPAQTLHQFTGVGTPTDLSILVKYQPTRLTWKFTEMNPLPGTCMTANPTIAGDFIMNPASAFADGTVVIDGVTYYKYKLPQTFTFNCTGTYEVPVESYSPGINNCGNREMFYPFVEVKAQPIVDFTYQNVTMCSKDTLYLTGPVSGLSGVIPFQMVRWEWYLPGGVIGRQKDTAIVLPAGTHEIKMVAITPEGLLSDTVRKTITIYPPPTTVLTATPDVACIGQNITFTQTASYGNPAIPITNYHWNFGDGSPPLNNLNTSQVHTYNTANTYTAMGVVAVSNLCIGDTAREIVVISPQAQINFTYPGTCLPTSGVAQFNAPATDLGGTPIASYAWNFGDPGSGANNTSTQQNPTHTYASYGAYTVTLNVTTTTGCSGQVQVPLNFGPRPALSYPAFAPVCQTAAAVPINTGTITNGVTATSETYSGPGVTGTTFNPATAGPGTHTLTYSVTTPTCTETITQTITVHAAPVVSAGNYGPVCINAAPVNLAGSPAGGTFSGPGVTGNTFNPATAGAGTHTITYNYTDANGCANSATTTITVNALPVVNAGTYAPVCINAASVTLAGTPAGGTFTGPGVTGNTFNPATAGIGTHTITYNYTDANGCANSATTTITVNALPVVNAGTYAPVCVNAAPVALAGTPAGGTFSGPGVAGTSFNPATAGAGTHTITYNYTNANGCANSATTTITVNALPVVSAGTYAGTCIAGAPITLTGSPAGGIFSGPGVSGNMFNPATAGAGTHTITYVYTNANGCTATATTTILVYSLPVVNAGTYAPVCINGTVTLAGTPAGGTFTGAGVTGNTFNPSIVGPGIHTIAYNYTDASGCSNSGTTTITVNALPVVSAGTYPAVCMNAAAVALAGTPAGGTFSGPGVTGNTFNPATAGAGTHTITYNYTDANGCANSATTTITVNALPVVNAGTYAPVCVNAAPVALAGTPAGGTFSGPGVTGASFNPATAGAGTHTITYNYTDANGCANSGTTTITVNALPVVNAGNYAAVCIDATPVTLNGTPAGGTFSGPGVTGNTFNPAVAGPGTHTITYNYTDANGCSNTGTTTITVNPIPAINPGTYPPVCINAAPVALNGSPAGGTFSGPGVTGNTFNPATAGAGTHTISYGGVAGCNNSSATTTITVNPLPVVNAGTYPAMCVNAAAITLAGTPAGGTFSGPGVTGSSFNPATAGAGTHTITYTYTDANGCSNTGTTAITVDALPTPSAGTYAPVCINATPVTLNGTPAGGTFSGPGVTGNSFNPATAGAGTHTITYNYTNASGCAASGTTTIVVNALPTPSAGTYGPICAEAASITLNGSPAGGTFSGPGVTGNTFNPATAGAGTHTITYSYTANTGCSQTNSTTITVHPRPTSTFTLTDNSICTNETSSLQSTGSVATGNIATWTWNLGDGNPPQSYTNANPITIAYTTHNNYTISLVTVSDMGCTSTITTQTIGVHPLPNAGFVLPAGICMPQGNAVFNNSTTVPDNSALTYVWNFGDPASGANNTSTATSPSHTYAVTNSYSVTLTATSAFGCVDQDVQVLDDFYDKPVASFNVTPAELCQGTANTFTNNSADPNSSALTYSWNFGDNSPLSASPSPVKTYTLPGDYTITLTVTNAIGCKSDPYSQPVKVHLQPVIDAGNSFVVPQGTSVQFTATANSPNLTFTWTPPFGLNDATILKPTLIANADQTYTLTATNQFGCSDEDFITVKILKPVAVPNIFTPNGDGIHDTWLIPNLGDYPGCTVEVFNRYGQKVFHSAGYGTPWNGSFKGKDMPVGTYYYVIQLQNGFKPMTGSVTIVR